MEVKSIALVAHDNRKKDLVEWAEWNYKDLRQDNSDDSSCTGQENGFTIKLGDQF